MLKPQRLTTLDHEFWSQLNNVLAWDTVSDETVMQTVRDILQNVRRHGDAALLDYTRQFDRRQVQDAQELILSKEHLH
jgi:histidinol dehydrogenase